jgi:hypothetical protein
VRDLDEMKLARVVDACGGIDGRVKMQKISAGEPMVQYSYHVRAEVAPLIREHFDVAGPPDRASLDKIASKLKENDRAVLEVAATHVFLKRESKLSGPDLDAELRRLKGHLTSAFAKANELLQSFNLC